MIGFEKNILQQDQLLHSASDDECNPWQHIENIQKNSLDKLMQAFIREGVLPVFESQDKIFFNLTETNRIVYVENATTASLSRYTSFGNIFLQDINRDVTQIRSPLELLGIFLSEIKSPTDREKWETLALEISDHLRNAVLGSYASCNLNKRITDESRSQGFVNLLQWVESQKDGFNANVFFEQWAHQGHPYHPCGKTKFGLTIEDVVKYSPEFCSEVPLMIAAVKKDILHIEAMDPSSDYMTWFAENYPSTWTQWLQELTARELSSQDYLPVPMHPWQAQNKVANLFESFISSGEIIFLEHVSIKASPTLSFRSLAPSEDMRGAHIKLPIAVQATSAFRTLSLEATENAPRVSRMLNDIFVENNNFEGRLSILPEVYGLHLQNVSEEIGKHFTVIYRENTHSVISHDETAIVVAALVEKSHISGLSLIIELMQSSGVTQLSEAIEYFQSYVDLVLGSHLDLYLQYGIALEGHQQNTLAVLRQGQIVRFIARDFSALDIHLSTLNQQGYSYKPYPGSSYLWEDKTTVRNIFLHTVYQCHLGELVLLLANHFHCDEHLFWQVIKQVTVQRFEHLKGKMDLFAWQTECQLIIESDWPSRALLRMRLQEKCDPAGLFQPVKNPLV